MSSKLILLLIPLAGCGSKHPSTRPLAGGVAVEWEGRLPGGFRSLATARWCARDTLLEVLAVHNDTAMGFTLIPKDSLAGGGYSVFSGQVFTPFRPQATVAMRILLPTELQGFESNSGRIIVTEKGKDGISGTLEAMLRLQNGSDTIRLHGRFDRIPVEAAPASCGRANRPGAG